VGVSPPGAVQRATSLLVLANIRGADELDEDVPAAIPGKQVIPDFRSIFRDGRQSGAQRIEQHARSERIAPGGQLSDVDGLHLDAAALLGEQGAVSTGEILCQRFERTALVVAEAAGDPTDGSL